MNIGIFTDTYFPQVSGVATSIQTLRNDLERKGNTVYIFTTTDPNVSKNTLEPNIFRLSSIPFISFTDRRIAYRGMFHALKLAKELDLDIVHTQTEFSLGLIGKFVAHSLKIPCVHTYHTMYEDYLHYVLNGHLLKPYHVKQVSKLFVSGLAGVVAPSQRVYNTLRGYGITTPMEIIPTGVDLSAFTQPVDTVKLRQDLGLQPQQRILLTLSRIANEKKIELLLQSMPPLIEKYPEIMLVIVGDGPDRDDLDKLVQKLQIEQHVLFVGEVPHDQVSPYYHMAELFVSASDTESQGLTFIEAMAADLKCVVRSNAYTNDLFDDPSLGVTYDQPAQYVNAIIQYLDHPHLFDAVQPRQKKLYTISSDAFGDHILEFYRDSYKYFLKKKLANKPLKDGQYYND
ncbi:Glycosyl transferases group 1 family protein [Bombilactobacillus mellifer]|uniref:Glycosyl transferases group 1 family protein n=1 Tax=Bombilactobacillus mellifer TaxID=1218492 RepID=A0A0F4LTI8_9LACO|nr:glycosyltransferase family 4 protein [Bombilactobacillus mellifer]MBH9991995.1 glycosyltransferase family 4 protein [Lactobacillus sp. W8092]KJY60901.1 Glycosyl transferases group 1 family protein [Bombilactobacillus mellifer]MCT6826706.1 glycosyltransferase family 4 protein [Bombilactobacillus mellifer]MCT6843784.1 glycosyltransferase family 4 protein [Bombilactobacillus mellifer]MCT6894776.1 glycosyltransferase family 4 protein [Bombilactobacillus mellifer]